MIDWLYIIILLLSGFILVLQELTTRSQKKLIDMQHELLGAMDKLMNWIEDDD
jgi:hypothetical protein